MTPSSDAFIEGLKATLNRNLADTGDRIDQQTLIASEKFHADATKDFSGAVIALVAQVRVMGRMIGLMSDEPAELCQVSEQFHGLMLQEAVKMYVVKLLKGDK